ncbi:hypothetical protein ACE41A_12695 [Bacillus cytotoxicus]|uniref:hypothetical protein n=1 Tax=Bacillus cytotoxicus TaxID=580165 RepID=UPI0035CC00B5
MAKKQLHCTLFFLICVLFSPHIVQAHVKWFTHATPEKVPMEEILQPLFLVIAIFVTLVLAYLPVLIEKISKWKWAQACETALQSFTTHSLTLLKYGTVIALLLQVFSDSIFAIEFSTQKVRWIVWGIILLLILPYRIATQLGALGILILFLGVTIEHCLGCTIDYIFYVAVAISLFFYKEKAKKWTIPILYFFTGFSLCWVAMEKIIYPSMAIDVVTRYQVPTFGFPADVFVLLCAFIEFSIGYLLFIGILNRTLAVLVTVIFLSTTILFGITEIIGHFMLHIIFLIFLIEGTGQYSMPIKMYKLQVQQAIFIFAYYLLSLFTLLLLYHVFVTL